MTDRFPQPALTATGTAPDDDRSRSTGEPGTSALIEEDLLVEDVSIDGMCGVY